MPKKYSFGFLSAGIILLICCTQNQLKESDKLLESPSHFPEILSPKGNATTQKRISMGRYLFYDKALSEDSSLSCGSCHLQSAAFADHQIVSVGIHNRTGKRNVPSLANIGYHPYFFAEGGSPSLEMQMMGPINSENEMGFTSKKLIERLKNDPFYDSLAQDAYGRNLDLFTLTRSIAAFERSIISSKSPYDRYLQGDTAALTQAERKGKELFFSEKWACGTCHPNPLLSNFAFENIGLYEEYSDKGRVFVSIDSLDEGKFKVPSLRNVAVTYPYMHDGSLINLMSVIEHYNQGGKGHRYQSPLIRPLEMAGEEKLQLLAFLNSLTDSSLLKNPAYQEIKR